MSLVEVMCAVAVLSFALLGLIGGVIVSMKSNAISARRTQMKEFAQSRLERLVATRSSRMPNASSTFPVNCSTMSTGGAVFDPTVAPGVANSGWMLDVLDSASGVSGFDAMAGPTLVDDSSSGSAEFGAPTVSVSNIQAKTVAHRNAMITAWAGNGGTSCADPSVTGDPTVLCREMHVEAQTSPSGVPLWHAWVRVIQGGPDWTASNLVLDQVFAQ